MERGFIWAFLMTMPVGYFFESSLAFTRRPAGVRVCPIVDGHLRFIQAILGHAMVGTTEIYTRLSIQALKAVHDAAHPTAKMGGRRGVLESESDGAQGVLPFLAAEARDEDAEGESEDDDGQR